MPYYILPKDREEVIVPAYTSNLCDIGAGCFECDEKRKLVPDLSFPTRDLARRNYDCKTQHIVFAATTAEREGWQARERRRFETAEYFPVPWSQHSHRHEHYAHLSAKHDGLVAYTKDDEHGIADRQTVVRPGKYLAEFYADRFGKTTIDGWIAACKADGKELKFALTPDDVETVYRYGPESCMGRKTFPNCTEHPVRVYGDSDLAVAFYGPINGASARCVVWPAKKYYTRIYGAEVLRVLLERAGYQNRSIAGARVRAIKNDANEYLMPYVDYIETARLAGIHFVLGEGSCETQGTDGVTSVRTRCENCHRFECDCCECEHCGRYNNCECYCVRCDDCDCFECTCVLCDTCNELETYCTCEETVEAEAANV